MENRVMTDSSAVEYCPISVARTEWTDERDAILSQRQHFLPDMETEHVYDTSSQHFFARINDAIVGYLCIDPDGHISWASTSHDQASDIADALLRFAVLDAPKRGLSQLSAPAAHPWKEALL